MTLCDFWALVLKCHVTSPLFAGSLNLGGLRQHVRCWLPWGCYGIYSCSGQQSQLSPPLGHLGPGTKHVNEEVSTWFRPTLIWELLSYLNLPSWGPGLLWSRGNYTPLLCSDTWDIHTFPSPPEGLYHPQLGATVDSSLMLSLSTTCRQNIF